MAFEFNSNLTMTKLLTALASFLRYADCVCVSITFTTLLNTDKHSETSTWNVLLVVRIIYRRTQQSPVTTNRQPLTISSTYFIFFCFVAIYSAVAVHSVVLCWLVIFYLCMVELRSLSTSLPNAYSPSDVFVRESLYVSKINTGHFDQQ